MPAYLSADDAHPVQAARPYGMSKRLAEEMCAAWTSRTGIPTTVLRPVIILDDSALLRMTEEDAELGAFVHVDDVAAAVLCFLAAARSGLCTVRRALRVPAGLLPGRRPSFNRLTEGGPVPGRAGR